MTGALAAAVARVLVERLGIGLGTTVVQIDADVELTRALVGTGSRVIAVEAAAEQRRELARAVVRVEIVDGNATDMPLPPWAANAIVWCEPPATIDHEAALAEAQRVLAPGGAIVLAGDPPTLVALTNASRG